MHFTRSDKKKQTGSKKQKEGMQSCLDFDLTWKWLNTYCQYLISLLFCVLEFCQRKNRFYETRSNNSQAVNFTSNECARFMLFIQYIGND
jgi:hypothetical protein